MNDSLHDEIRNLYQKLIHGWNKREAYEMAKHFSAVGVQIGFDGSKLNGQEEILSHLLPIFKEHPTPPFITKVKEVQPLGRDAAILHAIAGMIPPGKETIDSALNAHQTMVAVKKDSKWQIELFQNTPAAYHGRPELVEQMKEELKQVLESDPLVLHQWNSDPNK